MFKNILSTALARVINAALTLVILLINTNNLGQEGLGTLGLVVLGITIILLFNNFIGGGALVYLVPRQDLFKIMVPSYLWAILISVFGAYLLSLFHLIPSEYTHHVLLLGLMHSLMTVNYNVLVGKEKIHTFNVISVIQVMATVASLVYFIYYQGITEVVSFIYALFTGYSLGFILGVISIWPHITFTNLKGVVETIRQIIKYGKFIQTANIIQMLNYRLSYYIIDFFMGRAALGVYNVGVQLTEGVWLVGKSVAMVQYARISNVGDELYAKRITIQLTKFTFILTFLILGVLIVLPESFYGAVLGDEFMSVRMIIILLAAGILATAISMMFSHYFTGVGKPKYNMIGSSIGFIFTLILGFSFIPKYGIIAAALTASVSYMANMVYLMVIFIKFTGAKSSDFALKKDDVRFLWNEIRLIRRWETGDGRRETGIRKRESGDGKRETGIRKRETGIRKQESGKII